LSQIGLFCLASTGSPPPLTFAEEVRKTKYRVERDLIVSKETYLCQQGPSIQLLDKAHLVPVP